LGIGSHFVFTGISNRNKQKEKISENTEDYSKMKVNFFTEYNRSNPITQAHASREYLHYLKSRL